MLHNEYKLLLKDAELIKSALERKEKLEKLISLLKKYGYIDENEDFIEIQVYKEDLEEDDVNLLKEMLEIK